MEAETPETNPKASASPLSRWQQTMLILVVLVGILPPGQIFAFMAKGPLSLRSPEELRWGCYYPLLWLATMGTTIYAVLDTRGRRLAWRWLAAVLSVLLLVPAVESWCAFFHARSSLVPPFYGFYPWLPTAVNLVALATTTSMSWRGWISVIGIGVFGAVITAVAAAPHVLPVAERIRDQYPIALQVIDSWESASVRSPESPHVRWDDFWVGLRHLAGLEGLHELSLGGTDVQDDDLKHLPGLHSLQNLDLSNTAITDQGLQHLLVISSLKWVDVGGTDITLDGIEEWERRFADQHGGHCWVRGKEQNR